MIRHLDVSHLWTFRYPDVSLSDVSPPVRKFVNCEIVRTSLSSGSETPREVAKRYTDRNVRNVEVANRQDSESPKVVAKRPDGELAN